MLKLLFFIPLVIFALNFIYRRYNNPYKLHMLFGKKGSGKSTYLAKIAQSSLKKKKTVYTNMIELSIPGLRYIDPLSIGKYKFPPESVVLLDEAGIIFDNRNFKSFTASQRDFFKLQRHYRVEIYLASQSFDIDKKLRDLTDDMCLCSRLFPWLVLLRPISRKVALVDSSSMGDSRIADNLKFRWIFSWKLIFIPKYSKCFDSFHAPDLPEIPFVVKA